ncbi:MAG: 2-hydroxyacyl-CoA dehydratase [Deltaproteobacteria bacterium]|nr:2-hydroxyacyl-CoA dehydratase [Deltaproteobacteria bacterium]
MIIAAGFQPVRLQAEANEMELADSYISSNFCHYIKHILDSGLQGSYEDIQGVILINSCDGMRRLNDLWRYYLKTPFVFFLELPRKKDSAGVEYFSKCLFSLKSGLEEHFNTEISDKKLNSAISLMNDQRQKILELLNKQKENPPPYSGKEIQMLCREESIYPKESTDSRLRELISGMPDRKYRPNNHPRILVTGNTGQKPILVQLIEQSGADVVAFDSCEGLQHYSNPVKQGLEPMLALAERYLLKPSCARMPGYVDRIDRLQQLVADFAANGVIYSALKFCDNALFEIPQIERRFKETGIPFLSLENDYSWVDMERVRIRIEAFIEMIT